MKKLENVPLKNLIEIFRNVEDGTCASWIHRRTHLFSEPYFIETIGILEKRGIIEREKQGRTKIIELTDRGRKLKELFEEIDKTLGGEHL